MDGAKGDRAVRSITEALEIVGELTKFKQSMLLLFSMYAAFIAAGGLAKPLRLHALLWAIGYMAVGSTTAVNMYFDRDIDALMTRTMGRPLPSRRVSGGAVLAASLAFFAASLVLGALLINPYFSLAILVGFVFDVVAYTLLLKRVTPLSIIAGAVAGGAPALGGWAAASGTINVPGVLFSLLVASWVPSHIWFLASYYRDDYRRARVPMLPAVSDAASVGVGIGLGSMVMGYTVVGLWLGHAIGVAPLLYGLFAAARIFALAVKFTERGGDPGYALKAFKEVNMHLGVFFLLVILEKLVALL